MSVEEQIRELFTNHPKYVNDSYNDFYFRYKKNQLLSLSIWARIDKSSVFPVRYENPNDGNALCELPLWYRELFEKANKIVYPIGKKNTIRILWNPTKNRKPDNILRSIWGLYGTKEMLHDIKFPTEKGEEYSEYWISEGTVDERETFVQKAKELLEQYDYKTEERMYEKYKILTVRWEF